MLQANVVEMVSNNNHPINVNLYKNMQDNSAFQLSVGELVNFPLPDEAHLEHWEGYIKKGTANAAFLSLKNYFYSLRFPIREDISNTENYKIARLRGVMPSPFCEGLILYAPDSVYLYLHKCVAGRIPVIFASNRMDFVMLTQAFAYKNEPEPIPDSMGACMVAGYNNWDRVRAYRSRWEAENETNCTEAAWQAEFKRLIPQKHLYQDRFVILHDGPYSSVPASEMGLSADDWLELSLKIRLEHECTHYFTKRVFGVMRRHVFDELLADYAGIVAALGYFQADWFLRFMGMENYPVYRDGGRLQNYLDDVSPDCDEFQFVQTQLKAAAENLERFDRELTPTYRELAGRAMVLLAICRFSLMQLAENTAPVQLWQVLQLVETEFKQNGSVGG